MKDMKRLMAALVVCGTAVFLSCSTTNITIDKSQLKKVSAIAIMKFECEQTGCGNVTTECEEAFRAHFLKAGKRVVERERLNDLLKEIERNQAGLTDSRSLSKMSMAGANALLLGKVTQNAETSRMESYYEYDKKTKKSYEKWRRVKVFTFQVALRLVSTTSGDTIMTMQNKYPEHSYQYSDSTSLNTYRARILSNMGDDLADALKEKEK